MKELVSDNSLPIVTLKCMLQHSDTARQEKGLFSSATLLQEQEFTFSYRAPYQHKRSSPALSTSFTAQCLSHTNNVWGSNIIPPPSVFTTTSQNYQLHDNKILHNLTCIT